MEDLQKIENTGPAASTGCIACGSIAVLKGYPNDLCESCRENYTRLSIPKGIIIFGVAIGLIFLFSIYKIPKNILLGIHLDKGQTAIQEKRYLTAQRELQKVAGKMPTDLEVQSDLLIASFYNEDYETLAKTAALVSGKNYEDAELFSKVDGIMKQAGNYFLSDSLTAMLGNYNNDLSKVPDKALKEYIDKNKDELYPKTELANRLFDAKSYTAADSVLSNILFADPGYLPALDMMTSVKRIEEKPDESIMYCDKILALNKESVYAMASKVRTLLKQKKDAEAMDLALKCYHLDENNTYSAGSLVLAYHFTNKTKERDDLLNKTASKKDSSAIVVMQYIKDVISGKETFRN